MMFLSDLKLTQLSGNSVHCRRERIFNEDRNQWDHDRGDRRSHSSDGKLGCGMSVIAKSMNGQLRCGNDPAASDLSESVT